MHFCGFKAAFDALEVGFDSLSLPRDTVSTRLDDLKGHGRRVKGRRDRS
jgi:hypothetical protein